MATGTGVAVNGGGGGGDEREDGTEEMAGRCLTGEEGWEGEEGEERKGSELGGNKVSLIPSLFFRQPSFLMEIVRRRGFLCNFFLFSLSSLFFSFLPFFFFFYLYYYRLPISFASGISLHKRMEGELVGGE